MALNNLFLYIRPESRHRTAFPGRPHKAPLNVARFKVAAVTLVKQQKSVVAGIGANDAANARCARSVGEQWCIACSLHKARRR